MKRLFDLLLALFAVLMLIIPVCLVAIVVRLTSRGPALYWSDRVGIDNAIFKMPKFRSMKVDTPAVATHLLQDPKSVLTPIGDFLRKSSLDELPQLWCILKGQMSFVGPRPALLNCTSYRKEGSSVAAWFNRLGAGEWARCAAYS